MATSWLRDVSAHTLVTRWPGTLLVHYVVTRWPGAVLIHKLVTIDAQKPVSKPSGQVGQEMCQITYSDYYMARNCVSTYSGH